VTRIVFALLLLVAVTLATSASMAQSSASGGLGSAVPGARSGALDSSAVGQRGTDQATAEMERRQARQQNEQRYADLKRDADRLLQLATELKLQVDKAGEHTLSLEAIRKADEIEKLARSVRAKMKAQ
jgi:hypothetical protein